MRIRSTGSEHGHRIPAEFAMGTPDGFGGNRNPPLEWDGAPGGTRSFVLLCIDPDAPTDPALVADEATPIPTEHPRGDFVHWVLADIPANVHGIAAGSASDDQKRIVTPAGAIAAGADYLVVGRPITQARDPVEAVEKIAEEMAG